MSTILTVQLSRDSHLFIQLFIHSTPALCHHYFCHFLRLSSATKATVKQLSFLFTALHICRVYLFYITAIQHYIIAMQYNTTSPQCNTTQYITTLHQHNTTLHQHYTTQYNTASTQYNTASTQYNTTQQIYNGYNLNNNRRPHPCRYSHCVIVLKRIIQSLA